MKTFGPNITRSPMVTIAQSRIVRLKLAYYVESVAYADIAAVIHGERRLNKDIILYMSQKLLEPPGAYGHRARAPRRTHKDMGLITKHKREHVTMSNHTSIFTVAELMEACMQGTSLTYWTWAVGTSWTSR